ncbi:MAG: pyrrolo-quinoline quinone [Planctomycetaceae bacterium]|nr:MAG: pyrrolo-quinoline quinone [Planctomycetaceae bacterium]
MFRWFSTRVRQYNASAIWLTLAVAAQFSISPEAAHAGSWPQFRGPNASGVAVSTKSLPPDIGPDSRHVAWKVALPPGHSSPVVTEDRIYLQGVDNNRLLTIALDRGTGKKVWEQPSEYQKLEDIHRIGSHAQCTIATDGDHIVSFFGSSGIACFDRDGKRLWEQRMGPFKNTFGAGSSPLIADGRVILSQDHDLDSFLLALDVKTGKPLWKADRSDYLRNYGSPVIWTVDGKKQVVVAGTLRVTGYDLETGAEVWTVNGIARFVSATPTVGEDNVLYASGFAAGNEVGGERFQVPAFDDVAQAYDKNGNGGFEEAELPDGPILMRFTQVDRDKDGSLSREEYELFRMLFAVGRNVIVAIRPGGHGDISESHVVWSQPKYVPFCASPLSTGPRLFTVRDRGLLTTLDAKTGAKRKEGRLEAAADYYASPVGGDGKVYLLDEHGKLTVVSDADDWQVLHTADFEENCYATPALVDNQIYLRTAGHLYCFGRRPTVARR